MAEKKIIAVIGSTGAQGGGLVRAILADKGGEFAVRAITRKPDSEGARALRALGAEVVAGDTDDPAGLDHAFAGAYGAYCVTNFWEHFSPEREAVQATNMARASKRAGVKHVIWSTLEDTRKLVPLSDASMPTLKGKYKVPHFDGKGEADPVFANEGAPTTYLLAAFYWENLRAGLGPKPGPDGNLVFALPLGGQKLPGIAAGDIGKVAYGIFKRGTSTVGERIGIAGAILSGAEMATKLGHALGRAVSFHDVPFDQFRGFGFPGADDLGNMFEYQARGGASFLASRDPKLTRTYAPDVTNFDQWLSASPGALTVGP